MQYDDMVLATTKIVQSMQMLYSIVTHSVNWPPSYFSESKEKNSCVGEGYNENNPVSIPMRDHPIAFKLWNNLSVHFAR